MSHIHGKSQFNIIYGGKDTCFRDMNHCFGIQISVVLPFYQKRETSIYLNSLKQMQSINLFNYVIELMCTYIEIHNPLVSKNIMFSVVVTVWFPAMLTKIVSHTVLGQKQLLFNLCRATSGGYKNFGCSREVLFLRGYIQW